LKNIIEKSVIEEKLEELELELMKLEQELDNRILSKNIEEDLMKQAVQIDCQLSNVMSKVPTNQETPLKNDKYQHYPFPIIATNL